MSDPGRTCRQQTQTYTHFHSKTALPRARIVTFEESDSGSIL